MNKLVDQSTGLLCDNCMGIKEIKTLQKLSNMEALNKKKYVDTKFINSLSNKKNLNVNLTNIGRSYNSDDSESEGEMSAIDFSPTQVIGSYGLDQQDIDFTHKIIDESENKGNRESLTPAIQLTETAVDAPKIKHQINFNNLCIDTELSSDGEDDDLEIEIVHQK